MQSLTQLNHPLILHKMATLRDKNTPCQLFRETVREISRFLCYEAMRDFPLQSTEVETPLMRTSAQILQDRPVTLVPILRAGLGMVDGILDLMPSAKVGHIGLYRNEETLKPVEYYAKLPKNIGESEVLLLDPMLATGGSAVCAADYLMRQGVQNMKFLCILSAPTGVDCFRKAYPNVPIFTAALDSSLNDQGYILPGLGDAGDRIFGTL